MTPQNNTVTNRVDSDEMPHYAAFHQSLHGLLRLKLSSEKDLQLYYSKQVLHKLLLMEKNKTNVHSGQPFYLPDKDLKILWHCV